MNTFYIIGLIAFIVIYAFEFAVSRKLYSGIVVNKQIRRHKNRPLFLLEVLHLSGWNSSSSFLKELELSIFVDSREYPDFQIDSRVAFTARRGRLTGWLYFRKLEV